MGPGPDHSDHNQQTYDRIAPLYRARQVEHQADGERIFEELEQRWMSALPPQGRIGDLGCGPALDGTRFRDAGYRVVGVDLSRGMLSTARASLPGLLVQADLRALPLCGGCLDGAWCLAALLHVPEEATLLVLEAIRAALRRDGVLALVTALGNDSRFESVPYAPEETRWFVYRSQPRLERQIETAGFRITFRDQIAANRLWLTTLARAT